VAAYVRPEIPVRVFRDASEQIIDYGNRWGAASPPEDSYSVDTNPERFAPLHTVADALIAHLAASYDTEVSDDPAHAADLLWKRDNMFRAVRLTPNEPDAAGLTFVFTSYPSVIVHAGLLRNFCYPDCGCDACDETWQTQADEMEWQTLAVAAGHYTEYVRTGLTTWVGHTIAGLDGRERARAETRATATDFPSDRLRAARRRLKALAGGWKPWPTRTPL
jgi:hypothetical protein